MAKIKLTEQQIQGAIGRLAPTYRQKQDLQTSLKAAAQIQSKRMRALSMFRPFTYQDAFLFCEASEVLVQGGTRSGKSTIVAVCIAAYALNLPVHTSFGFPVHMRPLRYRNDEEVGEIWIVGKQTNHARTIYRLLFEPGLFAMVRDKDTHQWRALQPGVIPGDDKIPEEEWRPSPPLINPAEVEFGWESKKEKMWKTAKLKNGFTLCYYPSSGEPKRGDPVHRIWIDEEIEGDIDYYSELQSRLSDKRGRIWWSSWPSMKCPALIALHYRIQTEDAKLLSGEKKKPDVARFQYKGSANPVIDENEKRKRSEGWTEAERRARDEGDFITDTILTYPEFDRSMHTVFYGDGNPMNDKVTEALRGNSWTPPPDWCCYFVLDPGTQKVGGLWIAIPPPTFWPHPDEPYHIVYREKTGRFNADALALHVKNADPGRLYHGFIIDGKAGDQTPMGAAWKVSQNYSRAFSEHGLRCTQSGDMFIPGSPVWITRSMKLRELFCANREGRPRFRIITHMCPELVRQLESNVRVVQREAVLDKPAPGQVMDLLVCAEYYASVSPKYVRPPSGGRALDTPSYRAWEKEESDWISRVGNREQNPSTRTVVCGIP